jgi:gluconolactonase
MVRLIPRLLPIALISATLFSAERLQPVEVTQFRSFSRGIAFDYDGNAFVSHGRFLSRVSLDGKKTFWTETGAPNGHKILTDGTHLVCDGSRHAVLHLDAQGKFLGLASSECGGRPLTDPKDLTLDPKGGFYFTDSGGTRERPAGEILFVDRQGTTHLTAAGLHFPQGIVLRPDGKTLLIAESLRNRILSYDVPSPGRLGPMKVFADLPRTQKGQIANEPEGLCLDQHGNLYVAHYGMGLVEVLSRKGRLIRQYPAGLLTASSVTFGGPKLDQLFITGAIGAEGQSQSAVFRFAVPGERGLPLPAREKP